VRRLACAVKTAENKKASKRQHSASGRCVTLITVIVIKQIADTYCVYYIIFKVKKQGKIEIF